VNKFLILVAIMFAAGTAQADDRDRYLADYQQCTTIANNTNGARAVGSVLVGVLTAVLSHGRNVVVPVGAVATPDECMAARGWNGPPAEVLALEQEAPAACTMDCEAVVIAASEEVAANQEAAATEDEQDITAAVLWKFGPDAPVSYLWDEKI
jgi:hypothetical protein